MHNPDEQALLIPQMQMLLGDGVDSSTQVTAAQVFLMAGMKKEALQCVHQGRSLEQISLALQIYLQLDRIDLAQKQLALLRSTDEDSILTQLGSVYIALGNRIFGCQGCSAYSIADVGAVRSQCLFVESFGLRLHASRSI